MRCLNSAGRRRSRLREKPVSQIAKDLGISESCLPNWMAQADVNEGAPPGLTCDEWAELIRLRRDNGSQAMEVEILKRASAYFARENVPARSYIPIVAPPSSKLFTTAPPPRRGGRPCTSLSPDPPPGLA